MPGWGAAAGPFCLGDGHEAEALMPGWGAAAGPFCLEGSHEEEASMPVWGAAWRSCWLRQGIEVALERR